MDAAGVDSSQWSDPGNASGVVPGMSPGSGVGTGDYENRCEEAGAVFGEQTRMVRVIAQDEKPGHTLISQALKRVETVLR